MNLPSLPLKIDHISSESLSMLKGRPVVLYKGGEEQQPLLGWSGIQQDASLDAIKIDISYAEEREVAAIDSSVIVVGESEEGFVLSGKVAVASRSQGRNDAVLIGPIIFYIGESNAGELDFFEKVPKKILALDSAIAAKAIRVLLERYTAYEIAKTMKRGLILIDGSLKESNFEVREASLKAIISECSDRENYVAGITKNTKIKQIQRQEVKLYNLHQASYIDVTDIARLFVSNLAANSYAARLSADGIPLRIDIPKTQTPHQVMSSIIVSDIISHGYPETLRSAHLLSIFTGAEEASVKSRIARNEGTSILPSFNVRRALLGKLEGFKK
jgi:hypothetical protein